MLGLVCLGSDGNCSHGTSTALPACDRGRVCDSHNISIGPAQNLPPPRGLAWNCIMELHAMRTSFNRTGIGLARRAMTPTRAKGLAHRRARRSWSPCFEQRVMLGARHYIDDGFGNHSHSSHIDLEWLAVRHVSDRNATGPIFNAEDAIVPGVRTGNTSCGA